MTSQDQYWQRVWRESQPKLYAWTNTSHNEDEQYSSRVSKLDAELLDEEIIQTLQDPLSKAVRLINVCPRFRNNIRVISTIKPSDSQSDVGLKLEPELTLLTRAILYKYSLWSLGTTYGAKLQGLRYVAGNKAHYAASRKLINYEHLCIVSYCGQGLVFHTRR